MSEAAIAVANAPVSYGAFELTVGHDPDVPDGVTVLDQVAAAGYAGIDLGPVGYLGRGERLGELLAERGLGLAGAYVELPYADHGALKRALPELDAILDAFDAVRLRQRRLRRTSLASRKHPPRLRCPGRRPSPGRAGCSAFSPVRPLLRRWTSPSRYLPRRRYRPPHPDRGCRPRLPRRPPYLVGESLPQTQESAPSRASPAAGAATELAAPDALPPEAGTPEAGVPEAGTPEAGTPEAGTLEAGAPEAEVPAPKPTRLKLGTPAIEAPASPAPSPRLPYRYLPNQRQRHPSQRQRHPEPAPVAARLMPPLPYRAGAQRSGQSR